MLCVSLGKAFERYEKSRTKFGLEEDTTFDGRVDKVVKASKVLYYEALIAGSIIEKELNDKNGMREDVGGALKLMKKENFTAENLFVIIRKRTADAKLGK